MTEPYRTTRKAKATREALNSIILFPKAIYRVSEIRMILAKHLDMNETYLDRCFVRLMHENPSWKHNGHTGKFSRWSKDNALFEELHHQCERERNVPPSDLAALHTKLDLMYNKLSKISETINGLAFALRGSPKSE